MTLKLTAVLTVTLQVVEKLDSAIVTLVLKMKEIVMLMMSVKMVLFVDQTIAQLHLVLTLNLIAVFQIHAPEIVGKVITIVMMTTTMKVNKSLHFHLLVIGHKKAT